MLKGTLTGLMLRGRIGVKIGGKGFLSGLHTLFGGIYSAAVALLNLSTAQGNQVAQALRSADNKLNSWNLLFNKRQREMNGHHVYH